jgi:quinol monooxygenase YgiN
VNFCRVGGGDPQDAGSVVPVIVVNRFRVPPAGAEAFRADLERAREVLSRQAGYLAGRVGRNVDEPELWVLVTEWEGPGSYRRALSSYDVKLAAVPTLSRAVDEPAAYESAEPGTELNRTAARSIG